MTASLPADTNLTITDCVDSKSIHWHLCEGLETILSWIRLLYMTLGINAHGL